VQVDDNNPNWNQPVWQSIEDLPEDWQAIANPELPALATVWKDQSAEVEPTPAFKTFMEQMVRRVAIETGVIERLYNIDEGITVLLIQHGIDEALIPFGKTDKPASRVVQLIRDQQNAVEALFDFVRRARRLSTSYIRELHQILTAHQTITDARMPDGRVTEIELVRGDWRKSNSMPLDGLPHAYCPPEHIAAEMDRLVALHSEHEKKGITADVEAAWLHHRFTQIHPFQDGNGRVARCLASLVFIQAHWFPLSIAEQKRDAYIDSLRTADAGDLRPLIDLFAESEKRAFVASLTLLNQVATEGRDTRAIVSVVADRISRQKREVNEQRCHQVEQYASDLLVQAHERFASVKRDIEAGLRGIAESHIWINEAPNKTETANWFGFQIVEAAKTFKYFANRQDFSSWIRLRIKVEHDTELLLSFHVPGYDFTGLLACTAIIFRREADASGGHVTVDLQTLTDSPFYFSYADEAEELLGRFQSWLGAVVKEALVYWQEAP